MGLKIRWLGVSGFEIETEGGVKIFIDPYLDRRVPFNPPPILSKDIRKADVILATHGHFDHFEDVSKILRQTNAKLVASKDICSFVESKLGIAKERLIPLSYDETKVVDGVEVTATKAEHRSSLMVLQWLMDDFELQPKTREEFIKHYGKIFPPDLMSFATTVPAGPLQGYFLVTETGFRIWNPTETLPIEELKTYGMKLRPQIVLIPVIGKWEQWSVDMLQWTKPRIAMIHTFDKMLDNQLIDTDVKSFLQAMKDQVPSTEVIVPVAGETYSFDLSWKRL